MKSIKKYKTFDELKSAQEDSAQYTIQTASGKGLEKIIKSLRKNKKQAK